MMRAFSGLKEATDKLDETLHAISEMLERHEENLTRLQVQMHSQGFLGDEYPSWMKLTLCT